MRLMSSTRGIERLNGLAQPTGLEAALMSATFGQILRTPKGPDSPTIAEFDLQSSDLSEGRGATPPARG
jgi:hypothetical protein